MRKRNLLATLLAAALTLGLTACGGKDAREPGVDLTALTADEIAAGAAAEGRLESVGMPDDWANWKDSWAAMEQSYGLSHYDTDLSSAEEISLFEAEADSPTKDIGDVGHAYAEIAVARGVVQPYKPSTWDSIPDWAKDPDGKWVMSYTGTVAFTVNTEKTGGKTPHSWAELRAGNYVLSPGNVVSGASSQAMVVACALANGGGLDDVQPGIDYFKELAAAGRLDPGDLTQDRLATGEIQVMAGKYDFSGLGYKDVLNRAGGAIEVAIPQDGAVRTGYCLIINKYAPHPHAAAQAVEYLLSDAGQIDRARGYAKPIRDDVEIPADVAAGLLPDPEYANVVVMDDPEALNAACAEVSRLWEEEVLPLIG